MAIFYNKELNGFFDSRIHKKIPENFIEITYDQHAKLLRELGVAGKTIEVGEDGIPVCVSATFSEEDKDKQFLAQEQAWANRELIFAGEEINKILDKDPKAKGKEIEWRNYRNKLRAWAECPNRKNTRPETPNKEII